MILKILVFVPIIKSIELILILLTESLPLPQY